MLNSLSTMNDRKCVFWEKKITCDYQTMQQSDSIMLGSKETILTQKLLRKHKSDIFLYRFVWICPVRKIRNMNKTIVKN